MDNNELQPEELQSAPVTSEDPNAVPSENTESEESTKSEFPSENELQQPFDLSILDDPMLDEPVPDIAGELAILNEIENAVSERIEAEEQALAPSASQATPQDTPKAGNRAPVKKSASTQQPTRKVRPRHKKGEGLFGIPNILVTLVWVGLTLLIGVTLGRMVWICASDVLAFGRDDQTAIITVYESDSIEEITEKLHNAKLIKYPGLFKLYASFAVDEGEIHPGIWTLNTRYDYHALVKMMSPSSSREVVKVMIPEGYSCRQIFSLLEENKVCTVKDMEAYASNGELNDYWFLEDVERGSKYCLEGFLFPDTYEFYTNDTPKNILNKMLSNFGVRFDEEMRYQIDILNGHLADLMRGDGKSDEYIRSHTFTVRDVVNVASMVEKETSSAKESYTIASVIYNRLFNWGGTPAYLNIDATIIYALDGKTDLTADDLKVDSPYNTYYHTGLTPGPISNPGLASLKAALDPEDTNFYFYVLDPAAGSHHFSRTQEEHEAFRRSIGG